VIVPALTAATANAVIHAGAAPVFTDVDPEAWTLDPARLPELVTGRTRQSPRSSPRRALRDRAIRLRRAAGSRVERRGGFGATCGSRPARTLATPGPQFNSEQMPTTAAAARSSSAIPPRSAGAADPPGRRRVDFLHDAVGVSGRMPGSPPPQLAQLAVAALARKRALATAWREGLAGLPGVAFQRVREGVETSAWMSSIRLDAGFDVARVEALFAAADAPTRRSFLPLPAQPPYAAFRRGPLTAAESLGGRVLASELAAERPGRRRGGVQSPRRVE
jgi:hypothetical protein